MITDPNPIVVGVLLVLLAISLGAILITSPFMPMLLLASGICIAATIPLMSRGLLSPISGLWMICISSIVCLLSWHVLCHDIPQLKKHIPSWLHRICEWLNEIPPILDLEKLLGH